MTTIAKRFTEQHPVSAKLFAEASEVFPDGVTHDARRLTPYPIYVDHARGSHKWDVDGNEYIDYTMGHGALLLGHLHPAVEAAVERQIHRGTHLGGSTREELAWGESVKRLIPSAERVRFTSSGTEATLMAVRLARAFTARDRIVRFESHFHGWNDAVFGAISPSDPDPRSPGIPTPSLQQQIVVPQNDLDALAAVLTEQGAGIAAVILEPTGASYGTNPTVDGFLAGVRQLTSRAGVLLIFDEVVTGFRASPGGAQERFGIRPDLTCLAKILAGGLPGGAVAGRAELLDQIRFSDDPQKDVHGRIAHPGTFNANPLSAAAGVACLEVIAGGAPNRAADAAALRLASGMNEVVARCGVEGCVYGLSSMLHIVLGKPARLPDDGISWVWQGEDRRRAPRNSAAMNLNLRRALITEGVDLLGSSLLVSAVHSDDDIDQTIAAFDRALTSMRAEGQL